MEVCSYLHGWDTRKFQAPIQKLLTVCRLEVRVKWTNHRFGICETDNHIFLCNYNFLGVLFFTEVCVTDLEVTGSNHGKLPEPSNFLLMWNNQQGSPRGHEHPLTLSSKSLTNKYIVSHVGNLLQFHDSLIGIEVKVNEQNTGRVMNKQVSDHCIQMRKVRLVL